MFFINIKKFIGIWLYQALRVDATPWSHLQIPFAVIFSTRFQSVSSHSRVSWRLQHSSRGQRHL